MVIFYKKWKKYNEIQLTKNKMDLNIRKMTNHPPSPVGLYETNTSLHRKHYTVKIITLYNKIRIKNLVRNLTPIFGKGEETQDTTFDIKFDINLLGERRRGGERRN